jgi:hypothetical protein
MDERALGRVVGLETPPWLGDEERRLVERLAGF